MIHCEIFGKTGCRRIVPGQYLAADPKGRAIMIAGIEKQKFVYIMNRDSANRLTISSPLEAHKSESILFSVVGVDVGTENPIFAMIELDYSEADQDPSGEAAAEAEKKLTYYELDLGLNHMVRKWSEPIARTANFLLAVPGGDDGPSGVLICGENWISYKHQGHVEVRAPLPRRADLPVERGTLIISGTMHKQRDMFFFMIQSELGDLYKVSLVLSDTDKKVVEDVVISVFDSIQPSNSLCITKTGLLFAASEFANHGLFQFQGIGDDENVIKSGRIMDDDLNEELGDDSISAARVAPLFTPSSRLQNLLLIDDVSSLAPITDMIVDDFAGEESSQVLTLCGRGHRSSLRVLRHGVAFTEMAVSELPGRANAVWTVRSGQGEAYDKYIVVSLQSSTLVLSIGETVEEVTDSGFLATTSTIEVALLEDNALLQVHANGIRHIRPDKAPSEWKPPGKRTIEKATVNSRQAVISLAGGEIICFELDLAGRLVEMGSLDLGKEVSCLDLGQVPSGKARSPFLAVGCWDDTVQLLSLDPSDLLMQRAAMSLTARADSVCLVHMTRDKGAGSGSTSVSDAAIPTLFLNVGLSTGVLTRVAVDAVTGTLSDTRQRFLGPKSVKLFRIGVREQPAVMALTTRAWLMYNLQGRYYQQPVSYETLEYVSSFASEQCPEGIVAVSGSTLRIVTVDNLGEQFNQTVHPLRHTPRKMCRMPNTSQLLIIETDQNEYNESERAALDAQKSDVMDTDGHTNGHKGTNSGTDDDADDDDEGLIVPLRGPMPPGEGKWASCIRVIEPMSGNTSEVLELTNNEAAFSLCTCRFQQHSDETFVVVGTARDLTLHPRRFSACSLRVYRLIESRLQLLHVTPVDDLPMCMCEFQGKLLVGAGKNLRLFELGKQKLLRKCENKQFPLAIVRLQTNGDRIYAADIAESVHFVKYRRLENTLSIFADDTLPRHCTSLCVLDYDTIGVSDKFGNVSVLRLPEGSSDDVEVAAGARLLWDQGVLSGAPIKVDTLAHYYAGEAFTSLVRCSLAPGAPEMMIGSSITGGLTTLIPFTSKEDMLFFKHLEMYMRQEHPNLCKREHLSYRSYYQPVKEVVDGDLCEMYASMPYTKQKEFAGDVDRTPAEVLKKLEEARNVL
jgi:splicing factor 3B subunit 3